MCIPVANSKKTRSYGRNLNLYEEFQNNGSKPLSIEFDTTDQQFRPVGKHYQMFVRLLSNEIDRHVPYYYSAWKNVPTELKKSIFTTVSVSIQFIDLFQFHNFELLFSNYLNLQHYFDLAAYHTSEYWEGIKMRIQDECAERYKDRKCKLRSHFYKVGGTNNVEEAKRKPHKRIHLDAWVELIDKLSATPEDANRSKKNKINRSKQPYGSYHGSQSLVNRRYKEVNN